MRGPARTPARRLPRRPSGGFTLVEVALALLVVSVGLMGVFALFPHGLDQSRKAIQETQAAAFADDIFNGYRALAKSRWSTLDSQPLPVAGVSLWQGTPTVQPNDSVNTLLLQSATGEGTDLAIRYRLKVETLPGSNELKVVRLRVWPGEFGATDDASAVIFQTQIFREGF